MAILFRARAEWPANSNPLLCMANRSDPRPILRAISRVPSARRSPIPSRRPILWTIATTDSELPKRKGMPSVSLSVRRPRSTHSIAKAIDTPVEMVSSPYSSHNLSAATMESKLALPHMAPNDQRVSYSGPSATIPAHGPSPARQTWLDLMTHPLQARVRTCFSLFDSALIDSLPSNVSVCQLCVPKIPAAEYEAGDAALP